MYVYLSGYAFRHALTSHAEIVDSDQGHIFRKYRHKNNKKVTPTYEKMGKNRPLPRYLPPVAMLTSGAYVTNAIFRVRFAYARYYFACVRTIYLTQKLCVQTIACR